MPDASSSTPFAFVLPMFLPINRVIQRRRHDDDIGHAPERRLAEIRARRVETLERDDGNARLRDRVERRQDFAFHPRRSPAGVREIGGEPSRNIGRCTHHLRFYPLT